MHNHHSPSAPNPQALMLEDHGILDFLDHLVLLGGKLYADDGSVPCSLMTRRGTSHANTRVSSDSVAALSKAQHDVGEGPCLAAIATGAVVVVDDARHDQRWPRYFSYSAASGFTSRLSVSLDLGPEGTGSLTFYAHPNRYFTSDKQRIATVFATQASKAMTMAMRVARHQDAATDMRSAMENRTTIDIAVGIIIGQNGCSQDEAVDILKRASNSRNKKLRDVAHDLILRATGDAPRTHFTN